MSEIGPRRSYMVLAEDTRWDETMHAPANDASLETYLRTPCEATAFDETGRIARSSHVPRPPIEP